MRIIFCIAALLTLSVQLYAQRVTGTDPDSEDDPYDTKSYFMFGANYLSNNVYLGRKDTADIPYISPYIGYHHKTGIYAKVLASDAPSQKLVDLVTLEAGYDHTFGEHIDFGVSADKYFYNKNTSSIRGNTKWSTSIYGQYSNDWLEPQVCFSMDFNKKTDYILQLQVDHDFKFADNTLHIIPAVSVFSGTQHYYDEYFVNKLTMKDKSLHLRQVLADAGKFKTLDYEISMKVTYRISKWLFTLIPTYAIPVNATTITFPKQTFTEQLSNTFYVELDVCHR